MDTNSIMEKIKETGQKGQRFPHRHSQGQQGAGQCPRERGHRCGRATCSVQGAADRRRAGHGGLWLHGESSRTTEKWWTVVTEETKEKVRESASGVINEIKMTIDLNRKEETFLKRPSPARSL
jgi:hypothetical protein